MLPRYVQLQEQMFNLIKVERYSLLFKTVAKSKVNVLIKKLEDLYEMIKKLQKPDASIRSALDYIDNVLEDYFILSNRLDFYPVGLILKFYEIRILSLDC